MFFAFSLGDHTVGTWLPTGVQMLIPRLGSDSPYLFWCAKNHDDPRTAPTIVVKIRVKLPVFPDGLYKDTSTLQVAYRHEYTSRYWSIMTGDAVLPEPVFGSVDGQWYS